MVGQHAPGNNQPEASEAQAAEPPGAKKRGRLTLRGHMVIDADEPLLLADGPADPPPVAPSDTSAEAVSDSN